MRTLLPPDVDKRAPVSGATGRLPPEMLSSERLTGTVAVASTTGFFFRTCHISTAQQRLHLRKWQDGKMDEREKERKEWKIIKVYARKVE